MQEGEILIPDAPIAPIFHHLPYTHKGLNPLVGRHNVAGFGSLNERMEQWLDHQLQPLVSRLPSYLYYTNHLLRLFQDHELMEGDM